MCAAKTTECEQHAALSSPRQSGSFFTWAQEVMGLDENSYRFASEFVAAVNRVNYNQDNGINALAGELSLLVSCQCSNLKMFSFQI